MPPIILNGACSTHSLTPCCICATYFYYFPYDCYSSAYYVVDYWGCANINTHIRHKSIIFSPSASLEKPKHLNATPKENEGKPGYTHDAVSICAWVEFIEVPVGVAWT